ncbi:GntP family permease [Lipingzhangella sp. LS1_29]|uniref:GntP family permease n=1 Tax=Lipingzhangella rawalii TaxID=2055835 RepID=A0ABU2H6G0_9ACTN|nr:GntP family permease [Lipingzhangella rawalii]MDS1270896.1 GntP family permease [Lipingzhangella rawalii]
METATVEPAYGTGPLLLIAAAAVAVLLVLIIRVKLHAFVALVLVSFAVALATQIPLDEIVPTMVEGFGGTLANVALLVGLGVMLGRLLDVTGGARVLADTLLTRFGERRAPMALGVASLLFGFPIFFDAGLIVLLPVIFSVARRFGGSVLLYALPAAGAFATMHAFVPPHPGPVAAADLLDADMGTVLLVGLVIAVPTWYLGSYLYGLVIGGRIQLPVPTDILGGEPQQQHNPPHVGTVLGLLLLPMLLIFGNTGVDTLDTAGIIDGEQPWAQTLTMLGQTPIALLTTVLIAMPTLGYRRRSRAEIEEIVNGALAPVCAIILITGAGGMFGAVLQASGVGAALAAGLDGTGFPLVVAAFGIAACLRVAQGSATVALTTTAGIMSSTVAASTGLSDLDLALIVIAIACGSTVLSHVNDSGFWLVGRFFGMDTATTLKTWTVMVTLIGTIGFGIALVLSLLV